MDRAAGTAAGTRLALILLGFSAFAPLAPGGDEAPTELHLSGSVAVFVLPAAPGQGGAPLETFRRVIAKARPQLEGNGVKVVEAGPVLLEHGSLLQRHRKIDFRRTRDFLGTVFFRDGHEPQIQRGVETEGELLSRAEKYFRFPHP